MAKRGVDPEVEAFIAALKSPMREEVRALRALVLAVSPKVREELKWNVPSFATTEHFATLHLRGKQGLQLVLHRGAKVSKGPPMKVDDPEGVLSWRGDDRALVTVKEAGPKVLTSILKQWITSAERD
jgi:hypothetical protein